MPQLTRASERFIPLRAVLMVLASLAMACWAAGATSFLKAEVSKTAITLRFSTAADTYLEVWASDTVDNWQLAGLVLGSGNDELWSESRSADKARRFYRLTTRPFSLAGDADGDGFDDVYELLHGMNPLLPDNVVVSELSLARTEIAAGGLETAPHQTEVLLKLDPPGSFPVLVWVERSRSLVGDNSPIPVRPARLSANGQGSTGDQSVTNPLFVTANANGEASLILTSGNEIGQTCRIHARAGTVRTVRQPQATSSEIRFEPGVLEVNFPPSLLRGDYASISVTRSFNGEPLEGHDILLSVNRIQVNGEIVPVTHQNLDRLEDYVTLDPILQQQFTDSEGTVSAVVFIKDAEGLDSVEIKAIDLQVITSNQP